MIINSNRFLDSNARSFVDVIGTLNVVQKNAINELVLDLKAAGIWSKMKAIYPFIGGTASSHKWNLKDPQDTDAAFRLVFNGGWTHSSTGALPNGTNGWANTYFNASLNQNVNSNGIGVYITQNSSLSPDPVIMSGQNNVNQASTLIVKSNLMDSRLNATTSSTAIVGGAGSFNIQRTSSTVTKQYKNNILLKSYNSGGPLPTVSIYLGTLNNNGTVYSSGYVNSEFRLAYMSDGLNDTESFVLYQIVEKYQASLGRNINPTEPYYFNRRFDNEANAFIFSAKISDFVTQNATNLLVRDLKFFNLWSKMKAVYPFVGGTASTHKFNLVNPQDSDAAFRILWSGGVIHDANGVTGNGTNAYGETYVQPSTALSLNSTHISFYSRTNSTQASSNAEMGIIDGTLNASLRICSRNGSNFAVYSVNDNSTGVVSSITDSTGIWIASRTASNVRKLYRNGNLLNSSTTVSVALTTATIPVLGQKAANNTMNHYSIKNFSFATVGDGLTDVEVSNLAGVIEVFQKNLNRNVNTWYDNGNLLLDLYPNAAVAYSTRKLRNYYFGAALRVRRSSDNAELDVFFDSLGNLDTASLLSFVGAGDGFVTRWYDQSGNVRNATQAVAANQPRIVNAGVLELNANNKPAVRFIDTSSSAYAHGLSMSYWYSASESWVGVFSVYQLNNLSYSNNILGATSNTRGFALLHSTTGQPRTITYRTAATTGTGTALNANQVYLRHDLANRVNIQTYINGFGTPNINISDTNTDFVVSASNSIGSSDSTSFTFDTHISEFIGYTVDQSSNRNAINRNINNYFNIYSSAPIWDGTKTAILDVYPNAAVAYSIRALNSNYTGALLRVRRSSDNQEVDIYALQNGELDTAYLLSFVGASNGFVTTWYDQSGNGNNVTQTTAALQPQIVSSGTILQVNSKPSLLFNGDYMDLTGLSLTQPLSYFISMYVINASIASYVFDNITGNRNVLFYNQPSNNVLMNAGTSLSVSGSFITSLNYYLFSLLFNGSNSNAYLNNSLIMSGNANTQGLSSLRIGASSSATSSPNARYTEFIIYPSNQTANRTAINTNINSYYNIYTPITYWDGSQAGILDYYPNAAVAYSVRALNSTYRGAILRVRRSSDNQELDIFALQNGELDTAALLSFVGAGSGFVTTWYDQSGNGNNLTQTTAANQPRIVNAGVLDVQNGKPTLVYDGSNDTLFRGTTNILKNKTEGAMYVAARYVTVPVSSRRFLFYISDGTNNSVSRMNMYGINTTLYYGLGARRTDGGTVQNLETTIQLNNTTMFLQSNIIDYGNSDAYIYINNNLEATSTSFLTNGSTSNTDSIYVSIAHVPTQQYANVNISEVIFYESTSNVSPINTNIQTYFGI